MWMSNLCAASALALLLPAGAAAAGFTAPQAFVHDGTGTMVQQVHSPYEAKHTLSDLGYYDIRLERSSLPYSFNACKRGVRFHVHVDYYGDLVQVDEIGPCREYSEGGSRYYGPRAYFDNRYRRYPRDDY